MKKAKMKHLESIEISKISIIQGNNSITLSREEIVEILKSLSPQF